MPKIIETREESSESLHIAQQAGTEQLLKSFSNLSEYMKAAGHWDEENMRGSVQRSAHAIREIIPPKSESDAAILAAMGSVFKPKGDPIVVFPSIEAVSLCPHHYLPVIYKVDCAYMVIEEVGCIGLSKIARVVKALASRPLLQEDFTHKLCEVLMTGVPGGKFSSAGAAVIVNGIHFCKKLRGVKDDAPFLTAQMGGTFRSDTSIKDEFYRLIALSKR